MGMTDKKTVDLNTNLNVLPCRCCGSRNIVAIDYIYKYPKYCLDEWIIACDCGVESEDESTLANAIARWNYDR